MKRFFVFVLLSALTVSTFTLTGCQKQAGEPEKMKVAFVECDPASGSSWVRTNEAGQEYLKQQLPWVEVTTVESIKEDPGCVAVFKNLADQGNKIIFADGVGYQQFLPDLAKQYPKVIWIEQMGSPTGDNIGSFYGYLPQARYLQGIIAGMTTKTNIIGFVGAYPISQILAGVNAFAQGVRSVNPQAKIKVAWTNSWYDPAKEKDATDALINAGADVIGCHVDSDAPLKAAAARGVYAMTSNYDWSASAPDAFLTANLWNWGKYFVKAVQAVRDGTWQPGPYMGSLSDGVVALAPFGPAVSADAKAKVDEATAAINAGTLQIFQGPLKDNAGVERVKAGSTMSLDEAMASMDWLLDNIEGSTK